MAGQNGSGGVFGMFARKAVDNSNPALNQQVQNSNPQPQQQQNPQGAPPVAGSNNPNNALMGAKPLTNKAENSPAGNGSIEEGETLQSRQRPNANPLDEFGKLWQNDPNQQQQGPTSLFKPDIAKLNEAVQKINFAESLPPELITKALGGDGASFAQAINSVAQQAFGKSILATSQMMEKAFTQRMAEIEKTVDGRVRAISTREGIRRENPAFSHPAVAPLLESVQNQFATKYPEATSDELRSHAMNYMTQVMGLFQKPNTQQEQENAPRPDANAKNEDWTQFFQ